MGIPVSYTHLITEETESELEEFIDYAKIVMGTLGHKVFEPFAPSAESADTEPVLYMEYGKGKASGKRTSDGFVVLKGSTINPTMTKSCPERTIKDRKKYEDKIDSDGILPSGFLLPGWPNCSNGINPRFQRISKIFFRR